jgi:hypothetical protein
MKNRQRLFTILRSVAKPGTTSLICTAASQTPRPALLAIPSQKKIPNESWRSACLRTKCTVHPKHRASVDKIEEWLLVSLQVKSNLKRHGTMRSRPLEAARDLVHDSALAHFPFDGVLVLLECGKHAASSLQFICGQHVVGLACSRALTEDRAFALDVKALPVVGPYSILQYGSFFVHYFVRPTRKMVCSVVY